MATAKLSTRKSSGKCGIYKIVCLPTGKAYYGSTNNWVARKAQHCSLLSKGRHHCIRLQRSWDKYGSEVFAWVWLEDVPESRLAAVEQRYLDGAKNKLNSVAFAYAPWRGQKLSTSHREAIKETLKKKQLAAKGYHYDKGHDAWCVQFRYGRGRRRHWFFKIEQDAINWVIRIKRLIAANKPYAGSREETEYVALKLRERRERTSGKKNYFHPNNLSAAEARRLSLIQRLAGRGYFSKLTKTGDPRFYVYFGCNHGVKPRRRTFSIELEAINEVNRLKRQLLRSNEPWQL